MGRRHTAPHGRRAHREHVRLVVTALAVDDETVSRIVLARMLDALGFEVVQASDVPEAAAVIDSTSFDLVVSDYLMPSGTGLDLVEGAKRAGSPFILLTGFGAKENLDDRRAKLVDAYLTKPVASSDLASAVESCCPDTDRP